MSHHSRLTSILLNCLYFRFGGSIRSCEVVGGQQQYVNSSSRSGTTTTNGHGSLDTMENGGGGDGGVLMYIDNSNIWINTMETSVKQLGFRSDIKYDLRTRVDIIKLLKLAGAGRPIIRAVLYGSEPPPVSTFWNNIKEIKFCHVDVQASLKIPLTESLKIH